MGDIADMMMDGDLCAGCGGLVDDEASAGDGVPRYCPDCRREGNAPSLTPMGRGKRRRRKAK